MAFWDRFFKSNNTNYNRPGDSIFRYGVSPNLSTKRNIYDDFGYPEIIGFDEIYALYKRNPLAYAAIQKISKKTFEEYPSLQENEDAEQTPQEDLVTEHFRKIRFWQEVNETDRRGMIGGFGALILRLGDGKKFEEPVDPGFARGRGGIEALVEVKPIWADQIHVVDFYTDERDGDNYGKPKMYQFTDNFGHNNTGQSEFRRTHYIHPDRLIIFSRDGTIYSESILRAGFNAFLDMEKLIGAGAEGFWRNSKQSPYLVADKEISNEKAMEQVGAQNQEEFGKFLGEAMDGFSKGYNKFMYLKGVDVTFPDARLSDPQWFYHNIVSAIAGSVDIPLKILIGTQSGERASGEDAKEWVLTNTARRSDIITPPIDTLIERMKVWGMLSESDWRVHWIPLTTATEEEKINRVEKMSSSNFQMLQYTDEIVFVPEEIREVLGYMPLPESEKNGIRIIRDDKNPQGDNNAGKESTNSTT